MAGDEEYELLPHKEILEIKKEIAKFKGNPDTIPKSTLETSINKLSNSIDSLMELFKSSAEDMKMERHDEKLLLQRIEPLIDKFNSVIEQNEKIAKGIVAVADMVKTNIVDKKEEPEEEEEKPQAPPFSPPPRQRQFTPGMPQQNTMMGQQFPPMNQQPQFGQPINQGPSFAPPVNQGPSFTQQDFPNFGQQQFEPSGPDFHSDFNNQMPPPPSDIPKPPSFDEPFPEPKKKGLFGFKK